ncbi:hypothetical protein RCL1_007131 [Eukaryota sp. TZLM3-RCL]
MTVAVSERSISDYVLATLLGRGSSGEVYYAFNKTLRKEFAIKILSRSLSPRSGTGSGPGDDQLREIALQKKLDHPNVLKLFEVLNDSSNQTLYAVLEYADGGSLMKDQDVGQRKPISSNTLKLISNHVASGLLYLHQNGIVHHDIKPSNLLVCRENSGPRIVISDFSISTFIDHQDSSLRGSPLFLAPECIDFRASEATKNNPAIDVYAFGVSLYLLIFGSSPFPFSNVKELYSTVHRYSKGEIELKIPPVDSLLEDLIRAMMNPNPKSRATITEVLSHPWLNPLQKPLVICTPTLCCEISAEEVSQAVTVLSNLHFETRQASYKWDDVTLTFAQRSLLVFHSAVNLLSLVTQLLDMGKVRLSDCFYQLSATLNHWTQMSLSEDQSDTVEFTTASFGTTLLEWAAVLNKDIEVALGENLTDLAKVNLDYLRLYVIPVLNDRTKEIASRLELSGSGSSLHLDCVGKWSYYKASSLANNFKDVFKAISNNPDSTGTICLICNGNTVLEPSKSYLPYHTILLDVALVHPAEQLLAPSDSDSHSDAEFCRDTEAGKLSSLSVLMPAVAVDILRDLLCNSRKYSPPGSTIRAAIWNTIVDRPSGLENVLRICVVDCGLGFEDPQAAIKFGKKEATKRRGFGRGFGLTKVFCVTTSMLNGTFKVESGIGTGTKMVLTIPIPSNISQRAAPVVQRVNSLYTTNSEANLEDLVEELRNVVTDDEDFSSDYSSVYEL